MKTNISQGKMGEKLAAEFLEKQGMKIIEKNWRFSRIGEVDIIAQDKDILIFVEVKTRTSIAFGHPLEAIRPNKVNTMYKLAEIYINQKQLNAYKGFRVDVIGILTGNMPEITHIKDVSY
ncbi:MAG TPA: YraN family protein [Candidatus Gastranaerophilales bacterium]|nr:YraN family protein [Candidatus Gastranaerophilales bacterium]